MKYPYALLSGTEAHCRHCNLRTTLHSEDRSKITNKLAKFLHFQSFIPKVKHRLMKLHHLHAEKFKIKTRCKSCQQVAAPVTRQAGLIGSYFVQLNGDGLILTIGQSENPHTHSPRKPTKHEMNLLTRPIKPVVFHCPNKHCAG